MSLPAVFDAVKSGENGLAGAEAEARLRRVGANRLPDRPPTPLWRVLLRQFRSPLIYLLAGAAVLSVVVGEAKDAGFIAVVLVLNALIGGYQEWRAERSSRALQKLLTVRAAVMRGGEVVEVDAEQLVPGDVVWLESGNRVPADVRLVEAQGFQVDESLLTGESLSVSKDATVIGTEATPLADRGGMVHAGSMVVRGRAHGVVVATGTATAVGRVAAEAVGTPGGRPPLLERMERFSRAVLVVVLVASVALALIGVRGRGYGVREMVFFAVALAVSAIPEGLPVALTITLAVATARMARRGVVVRRLAAVEGLGSCTLIASADSEEMLGERRAGVVVRGCTTRCSSVS